MRASASAQHMGPRGLIDALVAHGGSLTVNHQSLRLRWISPEVAQEGQRKVLEGRVIIHRQMLYRFLMGAP